jgi:predicted DNA-binding transcriptional regulator YafY
MVFGRRLRIGPTRVDGRVDVEVGGQSIRALVGELAGFGAAVEVLEPPEVREQLAEIGVELTRTYSSR